MISLREMDGERQKGENIECGNQNGFGDWSG